MNNCQVEETAKRATKPNRAFQARSSLEIDRFDHQSENSGRMRTLRGRASIQTWTSLRSNVVDTKKSNTHRCVYVCSCMCTFTKVDKIVRICIKWPDLAAFSFSLCLLFDTSLPPHTLRQSTWLQTLHETKSHASRRICSQCGIKLERPDPNLKIEICFTIFSEINY